LVPVQYGGQVSVEVSKMKKATLSMVSETFARQCYSATIDPELAA
jgi:hypothetical protein